MTARNRNPARCGPPRTSDLPRGLFLFVVCPILGVIAATGRAESLVAAGEPAPDLVLPTLQGGMFRLADYQGRPVVLLFGELYNANSVAAADDVAAVLESPALKESSASAFLVITEKAPVADLTAEAEQRDVRLTILHDPHRTGFAAYRVMVLPSLVVIDREGQIALPCAGYPLDFRDMITDALLYVAGQLTEQQFSQRRTATLAADSNEPAARAMRLSMLGEQLAQQESPELAQKNFEDALALDPDCIPAALGLGTLLLGEGNLPEAEAHFRHVLKQAPDSVEASLGLAQVQVQRGGGELKLASKRLRDLLRKRPDDPRVCYLAGVVAEKTGDMDDALGHYKRAAELSLYGQEQRWDAQ